MNKFNLLVGTVIFLVLLNFGILFWLLTQRGGHHPPPPHMHHGPKNYIIDQLGLNEEQIVEYNKLINDHRASIFSKEQEIRIVKNELYSLLSESESVKKDSLIDVLGLLQKDIEQIHFSHFEQIKAICNPDQLDEFNMLAGELQRLFSHKPPHH